MEEIWKDIEGYEGLYQVSNLGNIKSLKYGKEKILKIRKNNNGYLHINLYKECKYKTFTVHRLVAKAFIPNPNNFTCVNHKDEDKTNNCVWNLEWCDHKYNSNYGTTIERQINKRSKKVLCVETNVIYKSATYVGRQTGIHSQHISKCCNGKRKTAGGYHWKFTC